MIVCFHAGIRTVQVDWKRDEFGRWKTEETAGSEHVRKSLIIPSGNNAKSDLYCRSTNVTWSY